MGWFIINRFLCDSLNLIGLIFFLVLFFLVFLWWNIKFFIWFNDIDVIVFLGIKLVLLFLCLFMWLLLLLYLFIRIKLNLCLFDSDEIRLLIDLRKGVLFYGCVVIVVLENV